MGYTAIVVGVSSGGINAMKFIFSVLPADFSIPIIIVQHVSAQSDNHWIAIMSANCKLTVKEAEEKEKIEKGNVYISAANYHLLVEMDHTFSYSNDAKVNFARPSIDVLFETAAEAYKEQLIGIILTGSSSDGTEGMNIIKEYNGLTIAQDPETAESRFMPGSAISKVKMDHILPLAGITDLLIELSNNQIQSPK
jgi:two-component system chemotaxis response regulator CheB